MEIRTRNTNTLMEPFIRLIQQHGVREDSRNGPVLRFHEPVTVVIERPWERVNFNPIRDCNPFFHLMEALAMIGNVNHVGLMSHFAKNMTAFSDDGVTFNAFYGTRLREYRSKRASYPLSSTPVPQDQLEGCIHELRSNPLTRQAVALLWDPADLSHKTRDKACNLMILFCVDRGKVRMTTFNRSNDGILGGIMGANIVHLSFFHEYVALALCRPMGEWWHTSNNLHVYENEPKWQRLMSYTAAEYQDIYPQVDQDKLIPLFEDEELFEQELSRFLMTALEKFSFLTQMDDQNLYTTPFLRLVAIPMFNAWQLHKSGNTKDAINIAANIPAPDWMVTSTEWLQLRQHRASIKAAQEKPTT